MTEVSIKTASGHGVAERWRKRYYYSQGGWSKAFLGDPEQIYERLCALGQHPKPDDVVDVIGNKSWSGHFCRGCDEWVDKVVVFGHSRNGEDEIDLCPDCIEAAHQALIDFAKPYDKPV